MIGTIEGRLGEAMASLTEGLSKTSKGLSENAAKITESTVTYRDALMRRSPQGPAHATATTHKSLLAPRVQAREGVKARQILIGSGSDMGPLEVRGVRGLLTHGNQEQAG